MGNSTREITQFSLFYLERGCCNKLRFTILHCYYKISNFRPKDSFLMHPFSDFASSDSVMRSSTWRQLNSKDAIWTFNIFIIAWHRPSYEYFWHIKNKKAMKKKNRHKRIGAWFMPSKRERYQEKRFCWRCNGMFSKKRSHVRCCAFYHGLVLLAMPMRRERRMKFSI